MMRIMDLKNGMVLALILVGTSSALAIYAWQNWGIWWFNEAAAVERAIEFLRNSPTFRFDGMPESIRVETAERLGPFSWRITIAFVCRHSGYGDRTGKVLLQVLTPHRIRIEIERGTIISAIVDEMWDELAQTPIKR
jgi:hypothetical protein